MARITIEDCVEQVGNRIGLVVMVAVRTKQIMRGARPLVDPGENKSVVTALREVAAGLVKPDVQVDATGSDTLKHDPRPISVEKVIEPPSCSTSALVRVSPRPAPRQVLSGEESTRKNSSKISDWSSGAMPMPLSVTLHIS